MEKTIYNSDYEALILWIKTLRKSSGLTMRDLCQLLDCSIGYVQKVESGYHRLDALQLVRCCEAIGADVHEGIRILQKKQPFSIAPRSIVVLPVNANTKAYLEPDRYVEGHASA